MGEGTLTEFKGKKTQLFSIRHQIFVARERELVKRRSFCTSNYARK